MTKFVMGICDDCLTAPWEMLLANDRKPNASELLSHAMLNQDDAYERLMQQVEVDIAPIAERCICILGEIT